MLLTRAARILATRVLAWCLLTVVFIPSGLAQEPAKQEFYHDFRGRPLPPELVLYQAEEENLVQAEPGGLRITLPADYHHPAGGVGVRTNFAVRGDFEATATLELVRINAPPRGSGAGVGIAVDTPTKGKQLRRVVGAKGNPNLLVTGFVLAGKGQHWDKEYRTPCPDNLLRLRLARSGTTLHYAWAPGLVGDNFVELHQEDIGTDDVDHVKVMALNAQKPCLVDVRLLELRIRSGPQGNAAAPAPAGPSRSWLAAAIVIGMMLTLVLTLGVVLVIYKQRQSQPTEEEG